MSLNIIRNDPLFYTKDGSALFAEDFEKALVSMQVVGAPYLFIHTAFNFGIPNPKLSLNEVLGSMLNILFELGAMNIMFPSFTFSFCNDDSYDVQNTRTRMGVINEFARNDNRFNRSLDPLLSVIHAGNESALITDIGKYSIGEGSFYYNLSKKDGVKFLFLGTSPGWCFTYMHFLEAQMNVPYRHHHKLNGKIINNGESWEDSYYLYIRHNGIIPNDASFIYEKKMQQQGVMKQTKLGDSIVCSLDKDPATDIYLDMLRKDMFCFVSGDIHSTDKTFAKKRMVAL